VERLLLDVQRAHRDLEAGAALAEVQASWSDPLPPLPSADCTQADIPPHKVAVLLRDCSPVNHSGGEKEEEPPSSPLQRMKKKQTNGFQHAGGSRASNKGPCGAQKGRGNLSEGLARKGGGSSQKISDAKVRASQTAKLKGSLAYKVTQKC
jgi:hypothetical protein